MSVVPSVMYLPPSNIEKISSDKMGISQRTSSLSRILDQMSELLSPRPLKLKNEGAVSSDYSYALFYGMLQGLVSMLPLSVEMKRGLTDKLEECRRPAVSGLILTVVFLSIVIATVTFSAGVIIYQHGSSFDQHFFFFSDQIRHHIASPYCRPLDLDIPICIPL